MYPINSLVKIAPGYSTPKFSGVYRVLDTPGGKRTRYKIENVVTGGVVNAYPFHLVAFEGSLADAMGAPAMPTSGSVVRFKGSVYVVTGATKTGAHLAELGGGKRYRGVAIKSMTVIPKNSITVNA